MKKPSCQPCARPKRKFPHPVPDGLRRQYAPAARSFPPPPENAQARGFFRRFIQNSTAYMPCCFMVVPLIKNSNLPSRPESIRFAATAHSLSAVLGCCGRFICKNSHAVSFGTGYGSIFGGSKKSISSCTSAIVSLTSGVVTIGVYPRSPIFR